jgi:hypothetical protein
VSIDPRLRVVIALAILAVCLAALILLSRALPSEGAPQAAMNELLGLLGR